MIKALLSELLEKEILSLSIQQRFLNHFYFRKIVFEALSLTRQGSKPVILGFFFLSLTLMLRYSGHFKEVIRVLVKYFSLY